MPLKLTEQQLKRLGSGKVPGKASTSRRVSRTAQDAAQEVPSDPPLPRGLRQQMTDHRLSDAQPCADCGGAHRLLLSRHGLEGTWACVPCMRERLRAPPDPSP